MTTPADHPDRERLIRSLFDEYIEMYAGRDSRLITRFSDNFSGCTGGGDFLVKDRQAWEKITLQDFEQVSGRIRIEMLDISMQDISNDVVVVTAFFHIHLPIPDHVLSAEVARLVLIFRHELTDWKIVHSSISIPYHLVREGEVYPMEGLREQNNVLETLVAERTQALHESELKLREHQKLTQDVIEGSPSLIYSLDKAGKFTLANSRLCKLLKVEYDKLIGQGREIFLPIDIAEKHRANDLEIMNAGNSIEFEETNVQDDGEHVYLSQKFPLIDTDGVAHGICGISTDITQRKVNEIALKRTNRALHTLSAGNAVLIHSTNESELLTGICNAAVEKGGYRMAWVGYVDSDDAKSIRLMAQGGFVDDYVTDARIKWSEDERGNGPTGRTLRSGKIQISQNIAEDPTMLPWREEALKRRYVSSISLPLIEHEKCFGALTIYSDEINAFVLEEIGLLEEMANDLSFGIASLRLKDAHQKQRERLNKNMLQTVETIASIVEMRDPYTSGHQARVANLAQAIAQEMGLPEEQCQAIHLAGIVHDLGKIKIPSEILSKPGRLDEIEYMLIKQHSKAGFDILTTVDFTWPIAQMVYQHHERMDGSGYPQGLKGDEILMGARILCVSDVVEAMSSHRPYRPGLGIEAALSEISKNRGSLYDPQVVDACVKLFECEAYVIPK